MPRFIRRVRRSLQRSQQISLAAEHSPTLGLEGEEDYLSACARDRSTRIQSRPRTPAPLPVIVDRGPPTRNRYADDDIFWNSVMLEADENKTHIHNKTTAQSNDRNIANEAASSSIRPPLSHARTEADIDRRVKKRRGLEQLERCISYGRERATNDLDVMFSNRVDYDSPLMLDIGRSDSPISPGSKAYDDFMDFPFHEGSKKEKTNGTRDTTTIGIAITTPGDQRVVLEAPTNSSRPRAVTWDICLNETLNNRYVDFEMRQAALNRFREVNLANGVVLHDSAHVSMAEAGLVPNLSRPIAASGFYDRIAAQEDPPSSMTEKPDCSRSRQNNPYIYDEPSTPPTMNGRSSPKDASDTKRLPNGVSPPSRSAASSSSSSTVTIRPIPPRVICQKSQPELDNLLSMHLSQNELNLLQNTLASVPEQFSSTDHSALTTQLHTIILALHDRIQQTEEILLPSLSTTLERKTKIIDLLLNDINVLGTHINLLEKTIDFGNNVLEGTWARTYETLRTLGGMKRKRDVRRWWGRGTRSGIRYTHNGIVEEETQSKYDDSGESGRGQELSKRELSAMLLTARQNVDLLAEDIEDMMNLVELCQDGQPVLRGVDLARELNGDDEERDERERTG